MAIPLTNYLETSEQTGTIVFAENITDRYFKHENMINAIYDPIDPTKILENNKNKQGNTSADNKISMTVPRIFFHYMP